MASVWMDNSPFTSVCWDCGSSRTWRSLCWGALPCPVKRLRKVDVIPGWVDPSLSFCKFENDMCQGCKVDCKGASLYSV